MSSRVHIDDPDERQRWIEGRRDRLELAREAGFGGVSWASVAAGVLAAYGAVALCIGIAAGVFHPLGITADRLTDNDWKRLGLGAGLGMAVVLLGAYSFGGYVAGRMARRAGLRHGVLVFVIGVLVLAAVAGISQLEGATTAIRSRLESLGAPTSDSAWAGVGSLTCVVALAGMLLGSLLGGVRGERWHQRLVARALDPDIGPEADLRADVEAQRKAAEKAEARARNAGALPASHDEGPTEPEPADTETERRREPEPTAVGPARTPSSPS
jgi:spore maturation protein SpmB